MVNLPERVTRDDLVTTLERQIVGGAVATGSALPSERRLAEQFSVSRTVVREALRILAERGLINVEIGRGVFVRDSDPTAASVILTNSMRGKHVTARHVIHGRRVLECETAYLAAQHRTDDDILTMQQAIVSLADHDPLLDRVRADLAFHLAVARAAHNPVLEAMFGAISGLTAEVMLRSLSDGAVSLAGVPQHQQILTAIVSGKPDQARDCMLGHLEVAVTLYGADLDRDLDTVAERRLRQAFGPTESLDKLFRLASTVQGARHSTG